MGSSHGGDAIEAGERAGCCASCTADPGQIIAIGMRDFFDDPKHMQALDAGVSAKPGLTQTRQISLAGTRVIQTGQERQVALIVAGQEMASCGGTRICSLRSIRLWKPALA